MDPYEVRHEILARLKDLEPWYDLGFGMDDKIQTHQLDTIKQQIADFLIMRNELTINGERIAPTLDKAHFVEVKLSGIQVQLIPREMDYATAIIGVIFTYPFPEGIPDHVQVEWDLWQEPNITEIPCVMTDPAGPLPYSINNRTDSVLVWKNYLKSYKLPTITEAKVGQARFQIPYISLSIVVLLVWHIWRFIKGRTKRLRLLLIFLGLLVAFFTLILRVSVPLPYERTELTTPESEALVNTVLSNIYRAFDHKDEGTIYDKLSLSATGDLLSDIYLQTKKSMVLEEQGGIQVKLKSVNIGNIEEITSMDSKDDVIAYRCSWEVEGDVGHWGHIHRRVNHYDAIMQLAPSEGNWKLFDLEIIDGRREL